MNKLLEKKNRAMIYYSENVLNDYLRDKFKNTKSDPINDKKFKRTKRIKKKSKPKTNSPSISKKMDISFNHKFPQTINNFQNGLHHLNTEKQSKFI